MRRFIILPAALLILSSCATKSDIPSEEVLRRSSQANQSVRSAAFELDLVLNMPSAEGTSTVDANVTGVMQNGGQQLQFDLEAEGTTAAGMAWRTLSQFVVAGAHETYMKIVELTMEPPSPALTMEQQSELMGTWWLLPSNGTAGTRDVTPDPRMLRMQTEIIDVTRDRGIITLNGYRVHHYDVVVNNAKLAAYLSSVHTGTGSAVDPAVVEAQLQAIALTGEIWIDADNYILRRAEWRARGPVSGGEPLMTLAIDIRDHNENITVSPPGEFHLLPVESTLQILPILTP